MGYLIPASQRFESLPRAISLLIPGIFRPPDGNRHGRYPAFPGQQFGTGIICGIAQSHLVGIIGPVITGNAFFPIWYHIHGFAGPRELGWSDTLYLFLESDGPVQCNAGMWACSDCYPGASW